MLETTAGVGGCVATASLSATVPYTAALAQVTALTNCVAGTYATTTMACTMCAASYTLISGACVATIANCVT